MYKRFLLAHLDWFGSYYILWLLESAKHLTIFDAVVLRMLGHVRSVLQTVWCKIEPSIHASLCVLPLLQALTHIADAVAPSATF